MEDINCSECLDDDVSLIESCEIEPDLHEAIFECRQCGHEFTRFLTTEELNNYK